MTTDPAPTPTSDRRTVLVVEDDESTAQAVAWHLAKAGFATSVARDGLAALTTLKAWTPDAVVLDLMLPHVDGWSIIRNVRRWAPNLPIIVMTARHDEAERREALMLGADDFLRKPFSARELVMRLNTALGCGEVMGGDPRTVPMGEMQIDRDRLQVRIADEVAPLTPLETKLLWILAEEKGRTLSRDEIFRRVWDGERPHGDRSVDVLVRRLRRKVDESGGRYTYVQTEHKLGYRLEAVPKEFPISYRSRR